MQKNISAQTWLPFCIGWPTTRAVENQKSCREYEVSRRWCHSHRSDWTSKWLDPMWSGSPGVGVRCVFFMAAHVHWEILLQCIAGCVPIKITWGLTTLLDLKLRWLITTLVRSYYALVCRYSVADSELDREGWGWRIFKKFLKRGQTIFSLKFYPFFMNMAFFFGFEWGAMASSAPLDPPHYTTI